MPKKQIEKIITNKKAYHNYSVLETYESGIELLGCEVKSLRQKDVNLEGSFVRMNKNEAFLHNMHIKPYIYHTAGEVDPLRTRRLLLKSREIKKLTQELRLQPFTLIPLEIYFKRGWAKIKLGLCKGKKLFDKRDTLKKKAIKKHLDRDFKNKYKV
ncbi:MAG TPA: SsrA-binding protein SmpB [Elusimicrobiales bacterium]|nr:SsrA-binding protein SmpB [Elusimicrobiales bacterium]